MASRSAVGQPWECESSNECLLYLYILYERNTLPPSFAWITLLWKHEKLWHEPLLKPVNVSCGSLRIEYWGDHLNCRRIKWHENIKINVKELHNFYSYKIFLGWSGKVCWVGHIAGMGELRTHTKFLSENVKRGIVLGEFDVDCVDNNELTLQKLYVMVWRDSGTWRHTVMDVVMSLLGGEVLTQLSICEFFSNSIHRN